MDWSILSGDLLCRSLSMFPVQTRGGSSISIASSPDQELVNFKYRKSQIDPYYSEVFYSAWSFLNSFDVERPPPWNRLKPHMIFKNGVGLKTIGKVPS